MQKHILLFMALCLHIAARGQTGFTYEYWFDDDRQAVSSGISTSGDEHLQVDVSNLHETLHAIHFQVTDNDGNQSSPITRYFIKTLETATTTWHYWFDDNYSQTYTSTQNQGMIDVDVSQVADGFHLIHIQADGVEHSISKPVTKPFIKIPQTIGVEGLTCMCMIDDMLFKQETISSGTGVIAWNVDVSQLPQGFHKIFVQLVTPSGAATNAWQTFFLREATHSEYEQMTCLYTIDGDRVYSEAGTLADGTFHFDLDVSSLEDGFHRITYMLSAGNGTVTKTQTQYFVKTPLGGNGVSEYWYWLNDQDYGQVQKVVLSERQNPYSLISLLPVESQPIRSKQFQLRMEQDKPVMYASNDIHLRFFDVSGRFTDVSKQFVDENVKQEVNDITLLNANERKTSARPEENIVKWYKVTVQRGDSIAFKTDVPCTIQVFSPNGEELYSASGSEAVHYGGVYAQEEGDYYVALHDVTAKNASSLSIDYQHIDKYAVLKCSPNEMGVLPCGQVLSISGNGFDKLKKVALRNGDINIVTEDIYASGKSEMEVLFALQGNEAKGQYDLVMTFEENDVEEELVVSKAITLADPNFADFEIKITDPRTVASPYPVSVSITNKGNMTYADIPFFMAYDNVDRIEEMCFLNFELEADKSLVEKGMKFVYDIDDFKGKGIKARIIPTVIPVLRAGETTTLQLGFKAGSHATYNVYGWVGTPWSLYAYETMAAIQSMANIGSPMNSIFADFGGGSNGPTADDSDSGSEVAAITLPGGYGASGTINGGVATSCVPDPCDMAGLFGDMSECLCGTSLGLGTTLGGINLALMNRHNAAQRDQLAQSGLFNNPSEIFPSYRLPNPGDILWNWANHCFSGEVGDAVDALNDAMDMLGGDPCPDPLNHPCNQYNPGDPNDIIGYLSEAGSKYMKEGTTDFYYTIEFENDPKLATASAHTIVVKDTLDVSRFDLSTFEAKSIKIGDKEMKLAGEKNFSKKTIDLRPAIDVIAQVSLSFDEEKGIATWLIESLDPMSMEPTQDAMQGVLPVNVNGNGQGEVSFDIKLKPGMTEGETVSNRAGIVFDMEDVIMTPIWINTVDATKPASTITNVSTSDDNVANIEVSITDELSGSYTYNLYIQEGTNGDWEHKAVNIPADSVLQIKLQSNIDYGFYVVATDSAGNVEQKNAERELSLTIGWKKGDVNGDGNITISDAVAIVNYVLHRTPSVFIVEAADVNDDGNISISDAVAIVNIVLKKQEEQ